MLIFSSRHRIVRLLFFASLRHRASALKKHTHRAPNTPPSFNKKNLASATCFPQHLGESLAVFDSHDMKAKIIITPKKAVLDPQGKTVQSALEHMGYSGIGAVHVGKYLEIEVTGDKETVRKQIDEACHKFLSNPVIEDYKLELE
jgi:phosphoribosylformylglycinamidine synthase